MNAHSNFTTLVAAERGPRDNHRTLLSSVLPRPIAFVSTICAEGRPNLAPFSFFNAVGSNPPTVIFSPGTNRQGKLKDTLNNVRATGEFVVNVVTYGIREGMNETAYPYGPEIDEFEIGGFTPIASRFVKPPRVAESPVQMECKLLQVVPIGSGPASSNICIGEVLCFHVADGFLLPDGGVDVDKIDLVGRMGGDMYATIRDRFAMPVPKQPKG